MNLLVHSQMGLNFTTVSPTVTRQEGKDVVHVCITSDKNTLGLTFGLFSFFVYLFTMVFLINNLVFYQFSPFSLGLVVLIRKTFSIFFLFMPFILPWSFIKFLTFLHPLSFIWVGYISRTP